MDLLGAVIDWHDNGGSVAAGALRSVCPFMIADFDTGNAPQPYCIVSEIHFDNVLETTGLTTRIQNVTVQFTPYAVERADVVSILDALEACYVPQTLGTLDANVSQMGFPRVLDRLTYRALDGFYGALNLQYTVCKSTQ